MIGSIGLQARPPHARILIASRAVAVWAEDVLRRHGWSTVASDRPSLVLFDAAPVPELERIPLAGAVLVADAAPGALRPHDDAALARLAAEWDSAALIAPALRLAAIFGEEPIARALLGLREQLAAACAGADVAHRIAGAAGTLGFAAASAAWMAVADGDAAALPHARHQARLAILAINCAVSDQQK